MTDREGFPGEYSLLANIVKKLIFLYTAEDETYGITLRRKLTDGSLAVDIVHPYIGISLYVIINKTDKCKSKHNDNAYDSKVKAAAAEYKRENSNRNNKDYTAHCGSAGLFQVRLRTVVAYLLTEF